jgi:hypothetical protein
MVANSLSDSLTQLLGHALGDVDRGKPTWLSADDVDILVVVHARLKDVFRHLSRLATACITRHDQSLSFLEFSYDLLSVLGDGQVFGRFN